MIEIDRRGLLVTAGSSLALAGCNILPGGGPVTEGIDPNYGEDPTGSSSVAFMPKRVCVVILKIDSKILHTYARYNFIGSNNTNSYQEGKNFAEEIAKYYVRNGSFPNISGSGTMRKSPSNLLDFWYSGQYRIYMFILNPVSGANLEFAAIGGTSIPNSVRFTQFDYQGNPRKANDTFFDGKLDSCAVRGVANQLQYLSNYYVNPIPNPPPPIPTSSLYSMNIATLMSSAIGSGKLPVIIDPDTGNGGGRDA